MYRDSEKVEFEKIPERLPIVIIPQKLKPIKKIYTRIPSVPSVPLLGNSKFHKAD